MLAIGLMSGTSLDGVDAALIETDGEDRITPRGSVTIPYAEDERDLLQAATREAISLPTPEPTPTIALADELVTWAHFAAVQRLLAETGTSVDQVDVVGFHGQTVAHRPAQGWTWQLGDGQALADALGIVVVDQLR